MTSHDNHPLFSKFSLFGWPFLFVISITFLSLILRELRFNFEFIMHQYWPFSIFLPKVPSPTDYLTLIAIVILAVALWKNFNASKPFWQQVIIVWCLVIATNLLQGFQAGFVEPTKSTNDDGFDYWQDAAIIHYPSEIVSHYVLLQPTLGYHSRVHPPLPLFIYFYLRRLVGQPWLASLCLSFISMSSLFFLKGWLARYVNESTARYIAILFGLTAAFQIYSLASIDALIAAAFTATIWAFDQKDGHQKTYLATVMLSLSMLLTFGVAWLIGVLLVIDFIHHKNIKFSLTVLSLVAIIFCAIALTTRYSYLDSFTTAASFEGAKNFFQTPLTFFSYCVTRVQDVLEPALFLGPYIVLLIFRAWKKTAPLTIVSKASLLLFCLFLATGAYYTGETARAALYLIVPLFAGLAPLLESATVIDRRLLFALVLGQTVVMQLFGYFTW